MNREHQRCLLDTSIQIKRLISKKWRDAQLDAIWETVEPTTSMYSLMEFKDSVIGGLVYLADLLNEARTKGESIEQSGKVRLEEFIQWINIDSTTRERDRRLKFANAYAAKYLAEAAAFHGMQSVDDIIMWARCEAQNLEEIGFMYYSAHGTPLKMACVDRVRCELGRKYSPLRTGRSGFTCRKEAYDCDISQFLLRSKAKDLVEAIGVRSLSVHDARLKDGAERLWAAICGGNLNAAGSKSIGQRLCFPIGDCIIVSKANEEQMALFTVDKDQVVLARFAMVPTLVYDLKENAIVRL